ncbi:ABC transporter permease [Mycobacterium sp. NPDC003449]
MGVSTQPRPQAQLTPPVAAIGVAGPAGTRWASWLSTAGRYALIAVLLLLVGYPLVWLLIRGLQGPDGSPAIAAFFETFTRPEVHEALVNSLKVNVAATLLAAAIGSFLAWALSRTDVPGRAVLDKLVVVPFITMTLVGSFAWVVLAAPRTGLLNVTVFNHVGVTLNIYSTPGQIFVMTVYFMPFVYLLASRALRRVDPALEDAAVICGRPRWSASLRVMLPLVAPAILAALILTFAMTMEEFGVFAILSAPQGDYVLTTLIWRYMNTFPADYTSASALACLLLALTGLVVLLQRRIMGSRRSFVVIGGREYRPGGIELRGAGKVGLTVLCWGYVAVSVVLPALGLLTVSMYSVYTATLTTSGLGLNNWRRLAQDGSVLEAARNSAVLSLGAALVALALTTVAAYLIHRRATRGKGLIMFLTTVPVAVPGVVLAVGIFQAYIHPPLVLYGTIWILFVAYVTRHLPYGMRAVEASLEQLHEDLEHSAAIAGAGGFRVLRTIVLPLLAPGMVAGFTIMFIAMFRELSSSVLLYSSGNVVNSVLMLEMYGQGNNGELAALALTLTVLTIAFLALVQRLTHVNLTHRS